MSLRIYLRQVLNEVVKCKTPKEMSEAVNRILKDVPNDIML